MRGVYCFFFFVVVAFGIRSPEHYFQVLIAVYRDRIGGIQRSL